MSDTWLETSAHEHFTELADAAGGNRPQFIRRRNGQVLILISKASLDQACLDAIRSKNPAILNIPADEPSGTAPDDAPDNAYAEARGLLGASHHRKT